MRTVSADSFTPAETSGRGRTETSETKEIREMILSLADGELTNVVVMGESSPRRTAIEDAKRLRATFGRVAKGEGLAVKATWNAEGTGFRLDAAFSL